LALGNSQEVEIKALNGSFHLPMVGSQKASAAASGAPGAQVRPVGLMAAKAAHLLDSGMEHQRAV
jgi:hypothetical protein